MIIRLLRTLLPALLCLELLACGQSGPLYLPDDPPRDAPQDDGTPAR